jgi:hypothetical protein
MMGGFRGHEADAGITMFSAINCSASFGLSRAVIIHRLSIASARLGGSYPLALATFIRIFD